MHQLRLFVALAEELHFGNAARRVFLTQPALSQQIKMLEQRLGTRLVERGTHAVELTFAGEKLLPAVRSVLESMDRLHALADGHGREVSGHLVLGVIGGEGAQPYTHDMLAELRRRYPEITVEIRSLGFSDHFHSVARGDVDAAVLVQPIPPELQALNLHTGPRIVVLPADDPLVADGAPVTLAQLADRTFMNIAPPVSHEWWDKWWHNWSLDPRPDGTPVRYGPAVDDIEALMHSIAQGQAIAFLPEAARRIYPRPGIAYVDVADLPGYTAALVWAPKNRSLPVVTALRDAARAIIAG